ncbi:threonine dehydratase [Pseudobacteriovorax antillogorgiicola]|uniref:Threonine dehydratase n=1 Tax=Pseudobacteriovorax antillogorgiicola TaxID=1513793 RepID=A0A1Y6CDJ0_9BACT|nr:threonine dehydratase [Pseudobacteriovorax antillogorgiicola]TCS47896.1 threonine dehydratase [Pseudobacteriovorax antillogorgiicola]SMF57728.1 threonine dehydratase [Pseudobacteriovorax antillogorgiicola]
MFDFKKEDIENAVKIVNKFVQPTALHCWPLLSARVGCEVWVKHENQTPTGAFKVRGGINLLHRLCRENSSLRGLITATRGNHGQSISFAGKRFDIPVTIIVPEGNSADQNRSIEAHGAKLIIHGKNFEEARQYSKNMQDELGLRYVDAFELDLAVGVATYALEMMQAIPDFDRIYVPVGMGSGIVGLIKTRDLLGLKTEIVGVVSAGAPAWKISFDQGKISPIFDVNTIADGIATSVPPDEAFEVVKNGAQRIISVSDNEVAKAVGYYYIDTHNLAETASSAALAGLMKESGVNRGKKIGIIMTGSNIDQSLLLKCLEQN